MLDPDPAALVGAAAVVACGWVVAARWWVAALDVEVPWVPAVAGARLVPALDAVAGVAGCDPAAACEPALAAVVGALIFGAASSLAMSWRVILIAVGTG